MTPPSPPPRVVLLTRYLATPAQPDSGIGRHFIVLADALAGAGACVHLVLLAAENSSAQRAALARLAPRWSYTVVDCQLPAWLSPPPARWPLLWLLRDLWSAGLAVRELLRLRVHQTNTVVETHSTCVPALVFNALGWTTLVRVSTTMARMYEERAISSRWLRLGAALETLHLALSPALLTHSARHRAQVCADTGLDPRRFALIPHGLPAPGCGSSTAPPGKRLLFLGRFERRKGIDTLLQALPGLLLSHPDLHVSLVGEIGENHDWAEPLSPLPAETRARVRAHGRLDTPALEALWRETTLLVAPSRYESFGLIYVEAMSRGIVPVGCAVGGVPDVINSGHDGLLVPPESPAALAAAIDHVLAQPEQRARLGANALATYRERFSDSALARASLCLYARLARHLNPPQAI
ncbi:MAG: glycosyltransferase family 4 protein [Verrucomicrobia bacterium]|nr:glycosyltransferase family 4 protein [Verrucomicrobiota bacterium]